MDYRPIMSTLGYVLSPDRREVLLVHRVARTDDEQFGKYNGLGGHMERGEDIAACMTREIHEEAGIRVTGMSLRGTVNWTGFGDAGEDWIAVIFLITSYTGTPFRSNTEGRLEWVSLDALDTVPMWEGDRYFLPLVFDDDPRPFHGFLPYENGRPVGWTMTRL